jgi:hypothetical protein
MTQMTAAQARVVNPVLTTVAQGYKNAAMVGMSIFPFVPTGVRGGKIITFGKEDFQIYATGRTPGSNTKRIQFGYSGDNYALEQHALEGVLPIENMQEAQVVPGINMGRTTINKTQKAIRLRLEKAQADLAINPAKYQSTNKLALSGSSKWSDYANSDPIGDVGDARSSVRTQIGLRPNVGVIGGAAWDVLKNHPKITDRIKYTSRDTATPELVASLFELDQLLVGDAVYADVTGGFRDVWGKNMVLAYSELGTVADQGTPTFGYTYQLENYPLVEEPYYDRPSKSWVYPVTDEVQPVIAGPSAGFLLSDLVD